MLMTSAILDSMSKPNQIRNSGATATFGYGLDRDHVGLQQPAQRQGLGQRDGEADPQQRSDQETDDGFFQRDERRVLHLPVQI